MSTRLDVFFGGLKEKRVAVIGIGVSNTPLAKLLLKKGVKVTVYDKKTEEELGEVCDEIRSWGGQLRLGEGYLDGLEADVIIRAPGMYFNLPVLAEARKKGVAVTSEMELFFDYCPCKIIAVTGSNGKTTTTSVIAEMLRRQGKLVHLGGNIGRALFPIIEEITPSDVAVVELSSFQLISMRRSPDVAVITNVAPNHLDVHQNMAEYIDAKENLYRHQGAFSRCVLNAGDEITSSFADKVRGDCRMFGHQPTGANGIFCPDNTIISVKNGVITEVMKKSDIFLPGRHNLENFMAAIAAVIDTVDVVNIVAAAREFKGVEHRQEFVRELNGVRYYNDSIATVPSRTIPALKTFEKNILLIAGGYDKHIPFEPMAEDVIRSVKRLILMGVTADAIEKAIRSHPDFNAERLVIQRVGSLEEAVNAARDNALSGDVVLLSPACASFDMFKNFEQRGELFKKLVLELK